MNATELDDKNTDYVSRHFGNMPEADMHQNDRQRKLIEAVRAGHGQAWLGRVNKYSHSPANPLWQWDGLELFDDSGRLVATCVSNEVAAQIAELMNES